MAPTESTPPSSPNQPPSEPKSSKGDDKPKEAEPKTDPSTTKFLQSAVSGLNQITDLSTEKHLREAT